VRTIEPLGGQFVYESSIAGMIPGGEGARAQALALERELVYKTGAKPPGKLHEHRTTSSGVRDVFLVHGEQGVVAQVEYSNMTQTTRYLVGDQLSTVGGVIVRRDLAGTSEVVYDEANDPLVKLHISYLITGP